MVFTSGATESNNLAIKGIARSLATKGRHIVTIVTEHPSVLDPCRVLEREGWRVTWLGVDADGLIDLGAHEASLSGESVLVSVMAANNEIGVLQPLAEVAALAHARGALVHTDASQAVGKIPVDVTSLSVDLLSLTAHKFYGPKGNGALYVREAARPRLAPIQFGGGHERGLRSGTLPTHQLMGLGMAASLAREALSQDAAHARDLTERLWRELESVPGIELVVKVTMSSPVPSTCQWHSAPSERPIQFSCMVRTFSGHRAAAPGRRAGAARRR